MGDVSGVPFDVVVLLFIVIPLGVTVFFGVFAFRRTPPLVFVCPRCRATFRRPAHRGFPPECPACHARDWNAP